MDECYEEFWIYWPIIVEVWVQTYIYILPNFHYAHAYIFVKLQAEISFALIEWYLFLLRRPSRIFHWHCLPVAYVVPPLPKKLTNCLETMWVYEFCLKCAYYIWATTASSFFSSYITPENWEDWRVALNMHSDPLKRGQFPMNSYSCKLCWEFSLTDFCVTFRYLCFFRCLFSAPFIFGKALFPF